MTEGEERQALSTHDKIACWSRHMQARELVRAAACALGPQARVVPLKGALLGALGVVDPSRRPISDVDLLVLGLGLARAATKLIRSGFHIADVPVAHGYLSLAPAHDTPLSIDLHTILMPFGLGRLRPRDMLHGATLRSDLFGTPVWVPSFEMLAIHCLANIIKDRIVHALPHAADDLVAPLAQLPTGGVEALARALTRFSLSRAAAMAVLWAHAATAEARLLVLLDLLLPDGAERDAKRRQLQLLRGRDAHDLRSRLAARASADSAVLRVAGPLGACADVLSWPLRRTWLHGLAAVARPALGSEIRTRYRR